MSYFSLHAYDADVWLREFRGLNQADIGLNPDIRFAAEAENVETLHGVLQPQAALSLMNGSFEDNRVETLAVLHRRWYDGQGSKNWYVCAAGGKLYQRQEGYEGDWVQIQLPADMPEGQDAFLSNLWSWVTYEIPVEYDEGGETVQKTVDVLLMSNSQDGMIMVVPPDRPRTWNDVSTMTWTQAASYTWDELHEPTWTTQFVETRTDPEDDDEPQKKFAVIERYAERIWGCGVPGEPDALYYSKAYDPNDWTQDDDIPENSAGEVHQPSWDGDQFYALKRFGDQLLAFKKNKIWRVMGVSPGEYTFHEQYGSGTEYFSTIAVYGERCFMAGKDGVTVYDGMNTTPYGKEQIEQLWKTVNLNALNQMSAALYDRKYYLAFPTGDSETNNAMLVYDLNEGSILFYPGTKIESFLPANDELYATIANIPGRIAQVKYDSWTLGAASGAATKWITPWMDFGYKRIQKGGFDLYFTPEVQDTPVTFTISIQTEKKRKTKTYVCQPLTEKQKAVPKEHRMKKLHFGGSGRKFRIMIETASGVTAPWRLVGGIQLVVETDPD